MLIVKKSQANIVKASKSTTILEYLMHDKHLSGAISRINGLYPEKGFAVNEICRELAYVISGAGELVTKDKKVLFSTGDVLFIDCSEQFCWKGNFKIFMVTSPKFTQEQHKIIAQ